MNKRKACATKRATALAEIRRWHGEFVRYRSYGGPPVMRNGVRFYQVGRNASHEFFIGVDADGQRYVHAVGENGWDENDNPIIGERIYPVESFAGHYLGHY